jgi:hypothetical protein
LKTERFILVALLLTLSGFGYAQQNPEAFRLFGVRAYSGELRFRGFYRNQQQTGDKISESQQSYYYSGGILMNASTYVIHPNFCELELGAAYMPESNKNHYLVIQDYSEVRTVKNLNIQSSFFNRKKVSLMASATYDESYARRENLTDVKTTNKYVGGSLTYSNKIIPLTFDFYKRNLLQTEIQTGRRLKIDQTQFEARADQAFTSYDKQKLIYSHKFNSNLNENSFYTANTVDDIYFNSIVGLGKKRVFNFNTTVSNDHQYGSYKFNRFQFMENLLIKMPLNFTFISNYNFHNTSQLYGRIIQHTSTNSLNHKLFNSLNSRIYFEYSTLSQRVFTETSSKTGFDLNYSKKLPWGQLQLTYGYFLYRQNYVSDSTNLNIVNEDYFLSDSKITLLKRPYINVLSVIVKDITGTIFYQLGLDYILITRGKYVEIRRIPSGLIPNDGTVYVDYEVKQPGSYKYESNNNMFSANMSFLKGIVDVYYRLATQRYSNLENTDFIVLNKFTQHQVGFRVTTGMFSGGAEYEDYNSTILPYHLIKVFLNVQKTFFNKLTLSMNGDMQNYTMLDEPLSRIQRYIDITGKVEYAFARQTRLNLDIMYRNQQGRQIDLDLFTARLEFTSVIYQLYLTAGVEVYRRNYIGEKINFKGTYIQISRRF